MEISQRTSLDELCDRLKVLSAFLQEDIRCHMASHGNPSGGKAADAKPEVVDMLTACQHLREGLKATKAQRDADMARLHEAHQRHGFEKVPWGEAFNQADRDSRDLAEAMCDMDWAASTATWLSRSDRMDSYEKDQLGIIHRMCVDANKTMERVRKSLNFYLSNYIFLSKPESSSTNPETITETKEN